MAETSGVTLPPAEAEKVDDAVRSLHLLRRIELILVVAATVAGVLAACFAAYSAAQVRSCTTPEGKCYQDNTVRARATTKSFLEDLNRQHRVIQCVLLVDPTERSQAILNACEEKFR